jgi:hypothetical protein
LTGASLPRLSQSVAWSCDSSSLAVSTTRQPQPEDGSNYGFDERVEIRRFIDDSSRRRINNLVSAFFKDQFDFAAYSAEEVADVFALCFDLRSALELAEFIQNNNHGN